MPSEFDLALTQIADEKGIPKEEIIKMIEVALAAAFRKDYATREQNPVVEFDPVTLDSRVFDVKTITEDAELLEKEPSKYITLEEGKKINPDIEMDGEIRTEITPADGTHFGRIAAQNILRRGLAVREKGGHHGPGLKRLRIFHPVGDPAGLEALPGQRQVRRQEGSAEGGPGFGLMALYALEHFKQFFPGGDIFRQGARLTGCFFLLIGFFSVGKEREVTDEADQLLVMKAKGRHPEFEPRTDRGRAFEKVIKPGVLNFRSLPLEGRRRQARIFQNLFHRSPLPFQKVAALTIQLRREEPAGLHFHFLEIEPPLHFQGNRFLHETQEKRGERPGLLVREAEIGHPELFKVVPDPALVKTPRLF